jgi:hypothetical protein
MILKYFTDLAVQMGNWMHYLGNRSTAPKENEHQPIHRVLRPDQLVTSEEETVQVTAMKLRGEQIAISSAKLRAIPGVKFNSWLLEAVVSAANNDGAWQE